MWNIKEFSKFKVDRQKQSGANVARRRAVMPYTPIGKMNGLVVLEVSLQATIAAEWRSGSVLGP